jgi:hypothetical protein
MHEHWRKPHLTVEGQRAFWDDQAEGYENADMTVDNQREMEVVVEQCRNIDCREIITFGGAVGCRDPKLILEALKLDPAAPHMFPKITFNDLSERQVAWARTRTLRGFTDSGISIRYIPGEIKNVAGTIVPSVPLRLVIGVYECGSFFNAHPNEGHPMPGFDEYLKNWRILGKGFLMDWVRYSAGGIITSCGTRSRIDAFDPLENRQAVKNSLYVLCQGALNTSFEDVLGLQIIGRSADRNGFFLSHWYVGKSFRRMLEEVFPSHEFSMSEFHFAKGMVFSIERRGSRPQGVITTLNNVIGNVLPHSQHETLVAMKNLLVA